MHHDFRQYLTELYDQPFPVFKVEEDDVSASYTYEISGGGAHKDYMVVNFGYIQPDEEAWDMDFTRGGSTALTGEGHASRVFASVMDAFKRFTKRYYAKNISFYAQKAELDAKTLSYHSGSRVKVYHSLIKRYAAKYGYRLAKTRVVGGLGAGGTRSIEVFELERIGTIREGSHDFKDFKDPWGMMSPEDRKEAGRLLIAALKAFPSSPRQKELRKKLNTTLKKYKIGEKK
jgi:hypothetical protein